MDTEEESISLPILSNTGLQCNLSTSVRIEKHTDNLRVCLGASGP